MKNDLDILGRFIMRSNIIASGSYIPSVKVTNDDLATIMDTHDEWIVQRSGIKTRFYENISNANMAIQAALNTKIDMNTIDCIVVCTFTPDEAIPTVANKVKRALSIKKDIPCFDINAACSGFIYGLEIVDGLLLSKKYKRILLIGSDFNSRVMDFTDRSTSILFGDGAGAVVVELSETGGLIDNRIFSQDDLDEVITVQSANDYANPLNPRVLNEDTFFKMKGSDVFKFAIKTCRRAISEMMNEHNLEVEDIDYVIAHQANQRILETSARLLGFKMSQFPSNIQYYGNTSAASIPILMDELYQEKKLKVGMKVLLVAFGGGLSYGVSYLQIS